MINNEAKTKYGNEFIGNVIRIIDDRTIIVNAGKHELNVGQTIQVYELGEEIKDLDGKVLCNYCYIKDELEVIQVEPSYSVCQKQETITKTYNFALSPLLETKKTEYVPLNIDKSDIQELKPNDPLVRVGDPIKLA
jgi:hypothetical protein